MENPYLYVWWLCRHPDQIRNTENWMRIKREMFWRERPSKIDCKVATSAIDSGIFRYLCAAQQTRPLFIRRHISIWPNDIVSLIHSLSWIAHTSIRLLLTQLLCKCHHIQRQWRINVAPAEGTNIWRKKLWARCQLTLSPLSNAIIFFFSCYLPFQHFVGR